MKTLANKASRYAGKAILVALTLSLGLVACAVKPNRPSAGSPLPESLNANRCEDANSKPAVECAQSPSAAFDQKGRLWVAWEQAGRVYVASSGDLGGSFSQPVPVNIVADLVVGGEAHPQISINKIGAIYVAWAKGAGKPDSSEIRFSRSLDGGKTFTSPLQISSGSMPALAVNDRDYIYLGWIAGHGAGTALHYAYSSDGGRSFHTEQTIADAACISCGVAMKIEGKKFPVIVWRQAAGYALTRFGVKDQPGPVQLLSDNPCRDCTAESPALSIGPQGDIYAAWTANGVHLGSSQDHGKTFAPASGVGHAQAAHADVLTDGTILHLVWTESDGKKSLLYGQSSVDGGLSWSPPRTLAESAMQAGGQPVLLNNQGRFYVVWQGQERGFRLVSAD
jgi:hypothetical protein